MDGKSVGSCGYLLGHPERCSGPMVAIRVYGPAAGPCWVRLFDGERVLATERGFKDRMAARLWVDDFMVRLGAARVKLEGGTL